MTWRTAAAGSLVWLAPLTPLLVILAGVATVWIVMHQRSAASAEVTALRAELKANAESLLVLANRTKMVDTQWHHDTVKFGRAASTFTTHAGTTPAAITKLISDTAMVKTVLAEGRDALQKCTVTITDCGARVAARDSTIALMKRQQEEKDRLAAFEKPPRFAAYVHALEDFTLHAPTARAGATFQLFGKVSALGAVEHTFAPHQSPHIVAGLVFTF